MIITLLGFYLNFLLFGILANYLIVVYCAMFDRDFDFEYLFTATVAPWCLVLAWIKTYRGS
jgi:hypothetical protein